MTTFIECFLLRGKDWVGQFKDQSLYLEWKQGQWGKQQPQNILQWLILDSFLDSLR